MLALGAPAEATPGRPMQRVYAADPALLPGLGPLAGGVALADLDGDGWRDLIVALGNDVSPQPLAVYYNQRTDASPPFRRHPDWYSDALEHRGGIAVGDVDGDGWLDLVVAVPFDRHRRPGTGFVAVHLNDGKGALSSRASYTVSHDFQALDVALGDVNGDGRLDLAVAGVKSYVHESGVPPELAPQRLHLNRDGVLEREPSWTTATPEAAASVAFADVNQDGRLDLVLGSRRLGVFHGRSGANFLPRSPDWSAAETLTAVFGLDVGRRARGDRTLSIVATDNCRTWHCTRSTVRLFHPAAGAGSTWSQPAENATRVLLVDANGDALLDLVLGQAGAAECGAPLLALGGSDQGFADEQHFVSTPKLVATAVAVGDLSHAQLTQATYPAVTRGPVVTLPHRQVERIVAVRTDKRPLGPGEWRWVPGKDWLTLGPAVAPGTAVEIDYLWSPVADLAAASVSVLGAPIAVFPSYFRPASESSGGK